MKKIANIVFYNFLEKDEEKRQACIFYTNGEIEQVSCDDAIYLCTELAKEDNISTPEALKNMINNNKIHIITGTQFEADFSKFLVKKEENHPTPSAFSNSSLPKIHNYFQTSDNKKNDNSTEGRYLNNTYNDDDSIDDFDSTIEDPLLHPTSTKKHHKLKRKPKDSKTEDAIDDSFDASIEDEDLLETPEEEKKGIIGFLKRGLKKIKKSKLVRKIVLFATASAAGFGAYTCSARLTKSGKMESSNINSDSTKESNLDSTGNNIGKFGLPISFTTNVLYDNYSFDDLLAVTQDETQYYKMSAAKETLLNYNGSFAEKYVEEGKDIRAALSFEEVVALQQAYNDFDNDEIVSYFNGAQMNANNMENNYKSATLQLMGAHVIETSENPVDISSIIDSEEGKNYYNHYHELFLAIKNAGQDEKLAKAQEFGEMIRKDFPIANDNRAEGIMHSLDLSNIESYKLSVVPMIAAYEMMYQNLDTDYTLNNSEIDFLNDIGLCNYAKDKFEKIETITLSSTEDKTNPTFNQFKNAMTNYLEVTNQAVIDDSHRELSGLDSFRNAINWHFNVESSEEYSTSESTTSQEGINSSSNTSYDEVITTTEKDIPASEKSKVDKQIKEENKKARIEAEKEAETARKEMQKSADEEAKKAIDEINQENKNLNKDIESSDGFVQDITTDGSNDMTGEPLPDPNNPNIEIMPDTFETTGINSSQNIYEYEEEISPEDIAEQYIEALADDNYSNNDADSYQYQLNR